VLVEVDEGLQDLIKEALGLLFGKWLVTLLLHVFLKIELEVLEDQEELVLAVNDLL